jgi:Endonuclease/Exonuclease/phosphatase family
MRIVTWNCCRGRPEIKLPRLAAARPDILAVQEAARPSAAFEGSHLWHGDNPHQGVMVHAPGSVRLVRCRRSTVGVKFFQPVQIKGRRSFNLLNIWVKPLPGKAAYMEMLRRGISAYRDFIRSGPTVVLGDLNSGAYFGPAHLEFVTMMWKEFRLVSAYHAFFGVEHGDETDFTYFDRTQHGRPYHIDYCFIPQRWLSRLKSVEVGPHRIWSRLSDHMPLTVDIV